MSMVNCMYCQAYINTQINGYYYTNMAISDNCPPIRLYYHGQCEREFENGRNTMYESPSNNREAVDRANRIHRNPARQFTEAGRLVDNAEPNRLRGVPRTRSTIIDENAYFENTDVVEPSEQNGVRGDELENDIHLTPDQVVPIPNIVDEGSGIPPASVFYDLYNPSNTRTNRRVHHEIPLDTKGRKTY